jgi:signal peptidase
MSYTGSSMNPTLRAGDEIWIMAYEEKKMRRGDIVVFTPPEEDSRVVHRVAAFERQGIKTKGDNNSGVDEYLLSSDHILGQVVYARRGSRLRKIYGGTTGRVIAAAIRTIKTVRNGLFILLRPAYRCLMRSGVFRGWISYWTKTRIVTFRRLEGTELQLMVGRYVIGRLRPGRTRWQIRRPFRMFLDEAKLPKNPSPLFAARNIENPQQELTGKSHSPLQGFDYSQSERRAADE